MTRVCVLAAALLLAGCNSDNQDTFEAVPEPTAENANALMAEAERAAANAQARIAQDSSTNETNQGDAR